ncbi:MAG TPA: 2OG-Fe(II) oxygenase [Casimicrobiaceae bacterium]|jgi:SM-20-related protein
MNDFVGAFASYGFAVIPAFVDSRAVDAIRDRAVALDAAGLMQPARVGRGSQVSARADIRGDRICWLDDESVDCAEVSLRDALERLRVSANRELQLGLVDFEGHYAIYPRDAGYARHRDRFHDDDSRVLSIVLYLNAQWRSDDGGALRIFTGARSIDVVPRSGTLVAFLSDRIEHEVLPAKRMRLSIAGWFRRRRLAT